MIDKAITRLEQMSEQDLKECIYSFNTEKIYDVASLTKGNERSNTGDEITHFGICWDCYNVKVYSRNYMEWLELADEDEEEDLYVLYLDYWMHDEVKHKTNHRIFPLFTNGIVLLSGYNYRIELYDKETKDKINFTCKKDYFEEKEKFALALELIKYEKMNSNQSTYFLWRRLSSNCRQLSRVMTEYVCFTVMKDWKIMPKDGTDICFQKEEKFASHCKKMILLSF